MKKHLLKSLLLTLMVLVGGSAWAGDKTVVKYSFDDAMSPSLNAGSRVGFDYDKTSVITSTKFLNAWNNTNGDPGATTVSLGNTDLSGETWTLSFEWAACGGCNSKPDHTTLKAGDTNLFDLTGNSNWNTTVTITYAGSDGTKTLPVPGCDKGKRFTAGVGDQLNTTDYWHHIVVTGSAEGVKMTITNSSTGNAVVEDVLLSETNVNPTSLIIEPCCGGGIGIDELSLTYFVEGEVIQTPTANYTAVNGIERTITATCDTEGATLYYSTDSENWTEGASITVSASGNVYFKAVKGNSESDVLTFAAVAEAITLNAPTIVRSDNTTVTISADQTDLLLSPTATIKYTYGNEAGEFTGSKTLTVVADATITAYAEATGYTTSATSERAVALFPEYVNSGLNTPTKTSGTSSFALSTETITVSEREYAALLLDGVQWGTNVYLQNLSINDPIVWGIRNGNWYINTTDPQWILIRNLKAGDIVVVDVTYPAADMVNATYSEKLSFGTKHAYIVNADGDVELDLRKINAKEMNYFYGVYSYSPMSDEEVAAIEAFQNAKTALAAAIAEAKAIETEGKEGVEALQTAIATAETALAAEDATTESLTNAKNALAEAVAAFVEANKPAFDPATAIVNAGFNPEADPLGWEKVTSAQFYDLGMGLIGTYQVRGEHSASTVDETHLATEFAAGLECRWNTNYAAFTQTTAELPAGAYKLTFDVENTNATTTKANYENRFNVTVGETTYADESTEWMDGKSAWTTHTIAFTLTEASPITISLGYGTGSNNFGVGNTPALFVSHLTLEAINSIEIALIDLQAAIEAAQAKAATYTVGTEFFTYAESEIKPLNDAIATAQAAYTAAESAEAVKSATETLNAFVATFAPVMNKPAADKEYVITNKNAELALSIGNEAVKIETEGVVKFTEVEGGWVLSNNLETPEYVFKTTGNTWTLSTTANKDEAYVVNFNLADGAYTIQGANGLFGTDNITEGSAVYANKAQSNNGLWTIAEYVAPEPVKTDYTEYIVNADLTGTDGWNTEGTKGYHKVGGVVTCGNNAQFDFAQTIANLPAGKYKVTAQAAYRYSNDENQAEQIEYEAIQAGTQTKFAKLYATVGTTTVDTLVQNRWEGASETNLYNGEGGVSVVNEKYVPNSTAAMKAWFTAGKYFNEVVFNLPADGAVTIGIVKTAQPEAGDFTAIGPWTLTRLGDADAEPEPEPEVQPGQDMTKYITNPSFETGNTNGWTYETSNDHGAKRNDNGTYTMTNCDGDYLFNIWSSGNAISQKIENLPNGTYLMKAVIATDANQQVQLNANGKSIKIDAVGKETGVEGELEFDVLNNTATIGAEGVNKYWYKVDNFRLTFVKGFDIAALKDIYKTALAEAQAITGNMSAEAKLALTAAIAVEVDTTDASALIAAAGTLTEAATTANASVAAYAKAKAAIDAAKAEMAATNVYTTEALEAYKAVYDAAEPKYEDGTLTDDEAKALENPTTITGWHDATIVDNFLLSAWDTNPDFQDAPYYINTWSTEGNNDGSNFKVPFFEYWTSDANSLGAKTLTATMNSLPAGDYDVTAWVRVRIKNGAEAPATGITLQANDGEAVNVAAGDQVGTSQMYLKEFTATGTVAEDGVLKIKFNVAADNNISWLSFKNVKFEKKPFKPEAIEGALYSWESPEGLPGEYGGKISYENGDGNRLNYQNSGYYTICLNGKKANLPDTVASANAGYMLVTLDEALSEGDTINITAYVNKNESGKKASAYILFDNGANVESGVYSDESNIALVNGVPTEKSIIVTEAMAGAKSFKMTRGQTGTNLFITKFVIMKKKVEPVELAQTLNVERYAGLGYTAQEATVDFTEAKAYLGVEEVTTEMLRVVNPDGTLINDYAPYDGWFNGEGAAETWGANTKINVKFFQAIPEGKFEICDMNGADSIGATYTVKWALVANDKQVTYTINVKFVEKPVIDLKFADLSVKETKTVTLTSELGKSYEGLTADVDVAAILTKLGVTSLNDVTIYAVQTDGSLDDNYKLGTTDGWRDSAGNWQTWGDAAYFYVKADFSKESAQIYEAGGMDGKNTIASWNNPFTYTATYAFVKTGSNDAVVLKVTLTYTVPTGINAIARDAQKNVIFNLNGQKVNKAQRGLYIINGKRVMVK